VKRTLALAVVLLALGAALVLWFLDRFEYADSRTYVGYQGEARSNPLLAAQRVLRELGFEVNVLSALTGFPELPAHGVIVADAERWTLPARAQDQLLEWVRSGNTLILEVKPSGLNDPLADALGIERKFVTPPAGTPARPRRAPDGAPPNPDASPAGAVREARGELYTLPWAPYPTYRIVLAHWQVLTAPPKTVEFNFVGPQGALVLGLRLGQGRVIAFNNFLPLSNWGIGSADNAAFSARIAGRDGRGPVFFLRNPVKASLWDWLLSHAAPTLAAAAVLIALWLWRAAVRAGPTSPDPAPARRRWGDHIEASGRFLWRSGARAWLAMRAREAAFASVERRIPGFGDAPPEARRAMLVRQLGLRPEEAAQLYGMLPSSPAALIAEARLLRRLHELSFRVPISRASPT